MSEKFAEGKNFKKLFWVFIIGCVFGTYYEELLTVLRSLIDTGVFYWAPRRGVFWGPFSPIYGFGAVLMTLALIGKNDKWYVSFIKTALIGGAFEYLVSFFQEMFLHTVAWDYTGLFLNINGRTTIPYMIVWGVMGVLFVRYIYPIMERIIEALPKKRGQVLTIIMFVFITFDIVVSWSAIARQTLRHMDKPPVTFIGEFYDKYFDDEYLHKHFPNTIRKEN